MERKISRRKKSVEIRDVSAPSKKALGKGQMRKISGGKQYVCPGDCDYLVVLTAVETTLQVNITKAKVGIARILPR